MSDELEQFTPQAIKGLAEIIAGNYTGSEITRLFEQAGLPHIRHDNTTKWAFVDRALAEVQRAGGNRPHPVLKVIQTMCNPQGYIGEKDRFEVVLKSVNSILGFYGLSMRDDGSLVVTGERTTTVRQTRSDDEVAFDARRLHPQVSRHGRDRFCQGDYFHSVFECCKAFDTAVRDNTHISKSGQPLMSDALSLNGPVKLNSQRNQSEKDEQQGIMYLCMGLMNAVRNPQAHEPELNWPMTRDDALDVLALLSFLFRKLETAIVLLPGSGPVRVQL